MTRTFYQVAFDSAAALQIILIKADKNVFRFSEISRNMITACSKLGLVNFSFLMGLEYKIGKSFNSMLHVLAWVWPCVS